MDGKGAGMAAANARRKAFLALLDPTNLMPGQTLADSYTLRQLCLQGSLPESPDWLRSQAWKVLLEYLPIEKRDWPEVLSKRRGEYYQFVQDFLPMALQRPHQQDGDSVSSSALPGSLSERDVLLDQLYKDLSRSRKNGFDFYQATIKPSKTCPLAPAPARSAEDTSPAVERLSCRHDLLVRLEQINHSFALDMQRLRRENKERVKHASKDKGKVDEQETVPDDGRHGGQAKAMEGCLDRLAALEARQCTGLSASGRSSSTSFISAEARHAEDADDIEPVTQGTRNGSNVASMAVESGPPPLPGKDEPELEDVRWHSLLRILYIYALLNPSIGYIQGMNEIAFVFLYAFRSGRDIVSSSGTVHVDHIPAMGSATYSSSGADASSEAEAGAEAAAVEVAAGDIEVLEWTAHAEADAFWCFSALIGEVRDLFDFDGVDHAAAGLRVSNVRARDVAGNIADSGMAGGLKKFSLRLKWLDEELWAVLRATSLDPRLPYYSFRWLACLLSTELTLPSLLRVWDVLLAQQGAPSNNASRVDAPTKVDFLIDICCALLVRIREQLIDAARSYDTDADADGTEGPFARCMWLLQNYPDEDIEPVLEMAHLYRQRRLASALTGDAPPTEEEFAELSNAAVLRERAAKMYQNLRNTTSPQLSTGKSWLQSFSPQSQRQQQDMDDVPFDGSPKPRSASGSIFNRYAEALHSSDAAASLSKMSTNLTAKAMTSWNRSSDRQNQPGNNSPAQQRLQSFSIAGQDLMNRARGAAASIGRSAPNPASEGQRTPPQHPAIARSSRHDLPQFPLPSVADTSLGRQEFAEAGNSQTLRAMFMPPSPAHSDRNGSESPRLLPSIRAALSSHSRHGSLSLRANGQKPLLLTGSARPPREAGQSPSATPDSAIRTSRKVSTGPLASNSNASSPIQLSRRSHAAQGSASTTPGSRQSSDAGSAIDIGESSRVSSVSSVGKVSVVREHGSTMVPAAAFAKTRQVTRADVRATLECLATDEDLRRDGVLEKTGRPHAPEQMPVVHSPASMDAGNGGLQRSRFARTNQSTSDASDAIPMQPTGQRARADQDVWIVETPERPVIDGWRVSASEQPRTAPLAPSPNTSTTVEGHESDAAATGKQFYRASVEVDEPIHATPESTLEGVERYKLCDAPVPSFEASSNDVASTADLGAVDGTRQSSVGKGSGVKLARSRLASRRTNSASSTRSSVARASGGSFVAGQDFSTITETNGAAGATAEDGPVPLSANDGHVREKELPPPSPDLNVREVLSADELMRLLCEDLRIDTQVKSEDVPARLRTPLAEAHSSIGALIAGVADKDDG
ncbi:RabGAP/TBC [Tilletiaria anomala UBC 951]|uniref:RabGAP/TBC n=1 Tax=Tilletiaria anomala (strain ATCC 24038 / CBS 436.72 / UBC 951) TaxID=1037660 RepID=A0A066WQ13_TILAU|nr:RabGAP/TBC [Tilletiaria anomala UBC 951]KDN52715.1 RabGAP/TBC [Tilletiaria anomala UBC 951]